MAWSTKSKNAEETTALKTKNTTAVADLHDKIPQQGDDEPILTPDSQTILVGSVPDDILLYQREFNNWDLKAKVTP